VARAARRAGPSYLGRAETAASDGAVTAVTAIDVDVADSGALVVTGDRRSEAVVLEVGSQNEALRERIDRAGACCVGGHCAARQGTLDRVARMHRAAGRAVVVEMRRLALIHVVAARGVIGGQGIDLVEGDFVAVPVNGLMVSCGM
jgi:hypothetical protein